MGKKRGKGGKGKRGNFSKQAPNPNPNSLTYNGPIRTISDREEADCITTLVTFTGVVPSSAGGVIDASYSDDPASYSVADWTNLAATWHEYRVLGFEVKFWPYNRYSKTTVVCTPLIIVIDRQSGATLGSYASAMGHSSAKIGSLEDPWAESVKMQNAEEAQFISTLSTVPTRWIKFYADGLSVSTTYGRSFLYARVQFRGRK